MITAVLNYSPAALNKTYLSNKYIPFDNIIWRFNINNIITSDNLINSTIIKHWSWGGITENIHNTNIMYLNNYCNIQQNINQQNINDQQNQTYQQNQTNQSYQINQINRLNEVQALQYLNKYPDLKKAFGNNIKKAQEHWINCGIKEGRTI